jgi:EF hand
MSAFDGNRDGRLNNAERSDAREFDRGDRNDDGALNRAEFGRVDSK